jgi:CrcB protein
MWMNGYLVVFFGAGIGGALRHGINIAAALLGSSFPYSTLLVNIDGSFAMGMLIEWFTLKGAHTVQLWRLFLTTSILGGFTTFSTFSLDTAVLWERGQPSLAALYKRRLGGGRVNRLFAGLFIIRRFAWGCP